MQYKKISEYLKTLSPEERQQHKDLIQKCLQREKLIINFKKERQEAENKLKHSFNDLYQKLERLYETTIILKGETQSTHSKLEETLDKLKQANEAIIETKQNTEALYLKTIKGDNKTYH